MDVTSADKQGFKLHSPTTAVNLSFLLTPIFGSYIQMKNWSKLEQAGKVTQGKVWLIASIVIYIALLTLESLAKVLHKGGCAESLNESSLKSFSSILRSRLHQRRV